MTPSILKPSAACRELRDVADAGLRAFLAEYFAGDRIRIRPPQANLLIVDGIVSVVLYRDPPYQVELAIIPPHRTIPEHCHDDIESYEVAFSGELEFFVEGKQSGFFRAPRSDGVSRDLGKFVPVPSDAMHGGRAGPAGACFLSVQRWRAGVTPTHVALNWRGAPLGREHEGEIAR